MGNLPHRGQKGPLRPGPAGLWWSVPSHARWAARSAMSSAPVRDPILRSPLEDRELRLGSFELFGDTRPTLGELVELVLGSL